MWLSIRLDKISRLQFKLGSLLQIGNMILDDNLSLNLCVMPIVYHVVIILDGKVSERIN